MTEQAPLVINYGQRQPAHAPKAWRPARAAFAYGLLVLLSLVVGVYAGLGYEVPATAGTVVGMLALLPIIWQRPALAAYILVGGAVIFETFTLGFPDSFTDRVPFFLSLGGVGGPSFLIATTAEILMAFALGAVVLRRMSVGDKPLELGPMFWGVALYTLMVAFGLVYGVGTGGNYLNGLWEARGQFYIIFLYLLVVNTIHDPRQLHRMMWVLLIGIAFKGLIGAWRFIVTLGLDVNDVSRISNTNSILSHEESYFFALFLVLGFILFLFRGRRDQLWFIALTSLPVLIAFLANQRRVGTLVLLVGVMLATLFAYYMVKSRRRAIVAVAVVMALAMPVYLAAMWNASGFIAEPARAVRSAIQPDERDAGSNDYRVIESENLKYNVALSPIIGRSYGKTIILFNPLPYIGDIFIWWDLVPHNTILWVWMRLGIIGFMAFWFLIGRSLTGTIIITRQLKSPHLQSVGVFVAVALVTWVVMGALDMGLVDFRETILIGALIGLVTRLPLMEQIEQERWGA